MAITCQGVCMSEPKEKLEDFEQLLHSSTGELVEKINQGAIADAVNLLQLISDARNRNLYQQIGELTRGLHTAIRDFHLEARAAGQSQEQDLSEMADATDRLNYIINLTQNAANRTMDKVEECVPVVNELGQEAASLRQDWLRLIRREMKAEEFRDLYKRIDAFLIQSEQKASVLTSNFSDITLAQDYQDLTGQIVKKVITLVHEVETSLVNLVKMASQVDKITGIQPMDSQYKNDIVDTYLVPEGPVVNAEKHGVDVVSGQDEVDDLLSSLGF